MTNLCSLHASYIVHSAFAIMCPLHFLFLMITSKDSLRATYKGLYFALTEHISATRFDQPREFPLWGFIFLVVILAISIAVPALLWFVAVTLAPYVHPLMFCLCTALPLTCVCTPVVHSLPDVTALWNTNAFFAYVLAVKLFGLKWEPRRLLAVIIATLGAALVVYGGSNASNDTGTEAVPTETKAPVVGDLLTLVASILYGIYQVLYKMYAALPSPPDGHFEELPVDYEPIPDPSDVSTEIPDSDKPDMIYPPPFGLYANALTTAIGVCTFLLLWIPIPILHYLGLEMFRLPTDVKTISVIAGIALSGVAFNAGLMV
jgi:hypothetical protein